MSFKTLLKRLQRKHFPSVRAFADALGIKDASRISRGDPFDVRGCLRLAEVTGEPPSHVLQAAGKGDIAVLIERLYGTAQPQLTPDQQALLIAFDAIQDPKSRAALIDVARGLAGPFSAGSGGEGEAGGGAAPPPGGKPPGTPPHVMGGTIWPRRARG